MAIRLNPQGIIDKPYVVCPHIQINNAKFPLPASDQDDCEYTEALDLRCEVCNKTFLVWILVN